MSNWANADSIRMKFSLLMSDMYQTEVPLYGKLVDLVADVNRDTLAKDPEIKAILEKTGEMPRLNLERHGAIRIGKAEELFNIRRVFAVMGMYPVGYYDLAPAGVPVHSTVFRAIDSESLNNCPFRIFTSLLRLELIDNEALRNTAAEILAKRQIFTPRCLELVELFEKNGGLTEEQADEFVREALETFRWHQDSPVSKELYQQLHDQHRLIADIVAFKGPHINHLTPRTLDIDAVQVGMKDRGITPKAVVEGPPRRKCPILLRQTSFKALEEKVVFAGGGDTAGSHTARFGEIEQRGVAVTEKGRKLYDELLKATRAAVGGAPTEANRDQYMQTLTEKFSVYPDTYDELRQQGLAFFHYTVNEGKSVDHKVTANDLEALIAEGIIDFEPIVYEDFLPVSAAGIFQSNLGENGQKQYDENSNRQEFEKALGATVANEIALYEATQQKSIDFCLAQLNK
ncbi:2-oxoadipate dioxygenase/decarboxylase HglS [Pelistega europaea]|uniref:2-oxoadipate dioxygenase/decarboxylase n=1 Tax=Pelistega europaea TaxID=106147 RepID=A0A7Y4LD05_9BURK|nr:VOC family protein [Pelistega europaea]NOL49976.1 VOC family protein [Pelistega europaea]